MTDAVIGIAVDSRQAEQGARRVVRSLTDIRAGAERLPGSVRRVEGSFDRMSRSIQGAGGALDRLRGAMVQLNPLLGAFAGAMSVAGFQRFTRGALDMADGLQKASQRISMNVEALQELQHAAGLAGISTGELEGGLERLTRRIGSGAVAYSNADQALTDLADRIAAAGSAGERSAIAFEAFGRSGAAMIPLLQGGSAALREARQEARELGLVFSQDLTDGAAALNDEMSRLNSVIQMNVRQGLLKSLLTDTAGLASIYRDPDFRQGLQTTGVILGFIARQAGDAATSVGALVRAFRDLDPAALGDVGVLRLSRQVLEAFGVLGPMVREVGKAANDAGPSLGDFGDFLGGAGDAAAKARDQLQGVITTLERQNERLGLTVQAMALGEDAVERLNIAFEVHDQLLAAGVVPSTMALHEAMDLTAEGADANARAIANLVKGNIEYQRSIDRTREAQEKAREAANDNARAQAEALREQAAPARELSPEAKAYAAPLLAEIFAEEPAA